MGFTAPIFLWAALAGLIPVVLHLVNRQKAPVMPFSTLRFLQQSVQRTRRRKRLHDASLLLFRVAALALIAVALARPTMSRLHQLFGGTSSTAMAIVLDNSASMSRIDERGSRWPTAQQAVEQLLDLAGESDSAALLVTCGPPLAQAQQLYRNQEVLRQSLGAVALSYERADLPSAIHQASRLLSESDAANKEIYVVTDMQQTSWESAQAKRSETKDSPKADAPIVVVNVQQSPKPNAAITEVELLSAAPVTGTLLQARVTIQGDATVPLERHIELYLDGKQYDTSPTLAIDAKGAAQHAFDFTFARPGLHRGELRLGGEDACARDDRLYFAVDVNPHLSVGIIQPEIHEIDYLDDAFYLRRALDPGVGKSWAIRATSLPLAEVVGQSLGEFAVVYCVNAPALTPDAAQHLMNYVNAGGHLVWVCGDNVDPVNYNAMNERVGGKLLPARLGLVEEPPTDQPDGWNIGWLDAQQPALAPLTEPASLYQTVIIRKQVQQIIPPESPAVAVMARLNDGQPLLSRRAVENGSVMMLGSSLHVDWTNLPLRPLFLPLIARLTFHLADARAAQPELTAGAPLNMRLNPTSEAVEITSPDGGSVRMDAPADHQFHFAETYNVGVYRMQLIDTVRSRRLGFTVNGDAAEVDSATVSQHELLEKLGPRPVVFCDHPSDLAETVRRLREGESLWELFLLAVLAALVAETFVGNRRTL